MPDWARLLREFHTTSQGERAGASPGADASAERAAAEEQGKGKSSFGPPPPRVEGYRVESLLGAHGQGRVYLAEDLATGESVAIKRWRVPSERAARELQALLALDHPGVVGVRAGAQDAELGLPCLIMDYVEGTPLSALCAEGALAPHVALRVALEVADALAHVHAKGLVHRDVKPANLLTRPDGSSVLLDFGLVKSVEPQSDAAALTGSKPVGTLPSMAPEQLGLLDLPAGPATDLYGLGATLYECLTGAVPFETNGAFEREGRDVWGDPPAKAQVAGVPAGLRRVVAKCLRYRPSERPASALALAQELRRCSTQPEPSGRIRGLALLGLAIALVLALVSLAPRWLGATPSSSGLAARPSAPALPAEAAAKRLVLQPGPFEGRDTYVSSVNLYRNDNFGALEFLRVGFRPAATGQAGEHRSFVAFELDRVPPKATLDQAHLELYCTHSDYGSGPARLVVAEVRASDEGRTPWVEGTGLLDRVLDGVAWSGVFSTSDPAEGSERADLSQPEVADNSACAAEEGPRPGAWWRVEVTETIRRWLANPSLNHGFRISAAAPDAQAGSWSFASSDCADADRRPRLVLVYRGPAPPAEPDAAAARALRLQEARSALGYARTLSRRGKASEAFAALSDACRRTPEWGLPYYERAVLAKRLGHRPALWLDAERSLVAARPHLRPQALLLFAEAWADRAGDSAQAFACAAAVVAACSAVTRSDADATFKRVVRRDQGRLLKRLARAEFRHLVHESLLRYTKRPGASAEGHLETPDQAFGGPWVVRSLWSLAAGDPASAARHLRAGGPKASADPLLSALARQAQQLTAGRLSEVDPRVVAAWVRVLVLYGDPLRAREALARGLEGAPDDASLRSLRAWVK